MKAILIKPTNRRMYSKLIEYIQLLKVPARILSEKIEDDELFIDSIEERMKSPQAVPKDEVKKFFLHHGIRI